MRGFPLAIYVWVLSWSLAALGAAGATNNIDVDGVTIHVPTPSGFVAIVKSQSQWSGYFDQAFPPRLGYRRLVSFVPENTLPLDPARIASLSRVVHLQMSEETGPGPVTLAIFAQHAKRVEAAIASNNRAPEAEEAGGAAGAAGLGPRGAGRARMDVVAYPFHESSPRHFAFSNLYRLVGTETSGRAYGSSTTIAHVLAGGKILVASVVGEPGDMAWTRTVCREWTRALLGANPGVSAPGLSAEEAARSEVIAAGGTADGAVATGGSAPAARGSIVGMGSARTNAAAVPSTETRRPRGELSLPVPKVDAPASPQK